MEHLALHAGGEGVLALLPRVARRRVWRNSRSFPGLLLYGTLGRSRNALQSLGSQITISNGKGTHKYFEWIGDIMFSTQYLSFEIES